MIYFFSNKLNTVFAVQLERTLTPSDISKLTWLFGGAELKQETELTASFVGPRATMVTPWSTNAVEITQNMAIDGIIRIEEFTSVETDFTGFDPMLSQKYSVLNQELYTISLQPEAILEINDIAAYNQQEGLSLSQEEIDYLTELAVKLGRKLTDSEVFGFSQVNSEHCRHKIFNGTFIIDGEEQPTSL
ncbi:MAG: phosphoribosylformylglycinamidine synthase, partial [Pedobacter sp.]|nr:phosphoribosylformylglycinamidine synthase [Pedobacter sp.]